MKQYKVLYLATSPKTNGGISYVIRQYQQWPFWKKYQAKWISTHINKNAVVKLGYFIRAYFTYLIVLRKYDIVHLHLSEIPSAIRKLPFLITAKLFKKKIIIHFHSFSTESTIKSRFSFLYGYMFKKADRIFVLSNSWEKAINEQYQLFDKTNIILNPCPKIQNNDIQKEKIILFAGVLTKRKGYCDLLHAFALIASKYPEWKIIFAGNGEIEQAKSISKQLGIIKQTEFAGWIDGEKKNEYFSKAEIFCLPSYAEGFPMAILEALAYGLPVITTPVGGLPDLLNNNKDVLYFQPGEINQLKEKLEQLMTDKSLRSSLSEASIKLANQQFNDDTINQEIDNIYQDLLK